MLFREPLLAAFTDEANLREEVRITLIYELAHYGIDDAQLYEPGWAGAPRVPISRTVPNHQMPWTLSTYSAAITSTDCQLMCSLFIHGYVLHFAWEFMGLSPQEFLTMDDNIP